MMTEYEYLYLASENYAQSVAIWQFWSGISFGYMALSHFAARQLNVLIVCVLSVLYIAFTLFIISSMGELWEMNNAYESALRELAGSEAGVSIPTQAWLATQEGAEVKTFVVAFFGTFIASLLYLPFRYLWPNTGES